MSTKDNQEALEALRVFCEAASEVERFWKPALDEGYPDGLPSFDEHTGALWNWFHAVKAAVERES